MTNQDLEAAWTYHDGTKHSISSVYNDPHFLDFSNQPLPFKIYPGLEPIPLPNDFPTTRVPVLSAISEGAVGFEETRVPDLVTLASILFHSAGITRRRRFQGGEMLFRAAACTGALYHIELYLACGNVPGLDAGVYHFDAHDFALRKLRHGDYRESLVRAGGGHPALAGAPVVLVCTSTFWRNAWKYRSRAYRHCFWDGGTILANLLAIASAHRVRANIVAGFVDDPVNQLLDLDDQREVAVSLVGLGGKSSPPGPAPRVTPLALDTVPLSDSEVDYPMIRAMHEASTLVTEAEVGAWFGMTPVNPIPEASGRLFPLKPLDLPADATEEVIVRRGSTRQFVRRAVTFPQLSTILRGATQGVPADFLDPAGATLNDLYLIVNAVDDMPGGAYVYHRDRAALELLKEDDCRRAAGYLGLQQEMPADASVNIFFLADLPRLLERYGNRGYRATQLEAGIIGGKLYLGAYAQRLGATGLTFFDDDVTSFFSPHADGKSAMFLVALGVPLKRKVSGPPGSG